ncbi:UDP-glucose:(glucosyl)LPS alpha-1,3-glucosyltransferase/UDP-D-galactose:(glucosyl)LPS alpha-1,3-D-galactosyltransferase/UDP-glucose:(galactosyl)LPS alpha-1,2-glucosyltransferase [Serratia fonticola]|uniref:UDP-glucose:(Glucosyl)LPS alpha-1, 3-glucosyltransferase/UDP-D-galactose:(Glucosyl)LPS alpha-1, 3-D-galactosyltransferase/UDP-glucose:(Galactosyl)LPS alpha-1,2-glucosyltransferase n=1 Tax=Serratia fonticola TaxID=47917 RepID=A0A542CW58_SERFO|nr:glycosyltransferase [Serratia fonticola]TQI77934.1 UDP-glucose:(glucosyl)LPS alpha-1,3-glucosyltransferase/UDP-D-galactose:(glucosyl)LPS alpha-1,3-D-galactosyltransferase/UDP-glucose:(galactosyl)LPS alpha-1,2-glucosyltransferase [Serratia fonticola]TQI95069.1 UDP-glucose:(glucosyl)LPS alpha-1,3-glucosyltransferase/UDP-D-galactose:(glucosyl)LPS alpha-1,3-D-galactosyltransferase/UDP-glucose:(galactosyl)LPS alpha-1,2-glucosyltransferase [Serratia fonticola]TVZ69567.1 UDP-glucose:(glucosyl)LPS al
MENNKINRLLKLASDNENTIKITCYQGKDRLDEQSQYHVAFGVDGNFIRHACITIQSLIEHAGTAKIHFHLITTEDTVDLANKFQALVTGTPHSIYTHQLSDNLFANLPSTALFTKATYYRFLAPYLLEEEEAILYLDADIVCTNPFTDLYSKVKGSEHIAFVVSELDHLTSTLAADVSLKEEKYFNAGVLMINVRAWLQNNISEKALSLLETRGKDFRYLDQDALNVVLEGNVQFIEKKYNTLFMLGHTEADYKRMPPDDTVFIHYAGADKPWQKWNKQAGTCFYTNLYQRSSWASHPLDEPKNDQQAKKMYKLLFREKKYLSGIRWYGMYIKLRYAK